MNLELDTIINIHSILTKLLNINNIYDNEYSILKKELEKIDNNFFNKDNIKLDVFLLCISNKKTECLLNFKNIVEKKLNNICIHEWVNDSIDIDPDNSQQIIYCKICELTKNNFD